MLVLGSLGLIFGAGLGFASRHLKVKADPRLEQIHGLLPGSNCGACGYAGCFGFAEALLSGKASPTCCRVSTGEIKEKIAQILKEET